MIIYSLVVLILLMVLFSGLLGLDASLIYIQIFFWVFGLVGVVSVLYLEVSGVYIIEQYRFAGFNGSAIALLFLFFWHFLGVLVGAACVQQKITRLKLQLPEATSHAGNGFFWVTSLVLLGLVYLNLFLSDPPPLLASGYVDRFGYIYATSLWPVLAPFGVVTIPIPIMLGWLLHSSRTKSIVLLLTMFYLVYLALIGQKFGGFILALFLLLLPLVVFRVFGTAFMKIAMKLFVYGGAVLFMALMVVYYHYSKYSLSEEFGGPLGLIAYRIFGMQGHTFWGAFDFFIQDPLRYFNPAGLYEGMQVVMRLISPTLAEGMIERGVNFTFGYFASFLINLNILSIPVLFLAGVLHSLLSFVVVKCVVKARPFSYFVAVNLAILFNGFVSMGSLSYIINPKSLFLLVAMLGIGFLRYASSRIARSKSSYCTE